MPWLVTGNLSYLTGQLCHWNGERLYLGKPGSDFGVDEGRAAARVCTLNRVAQIGSALGDDLDRVVRTVRLAGYVNPAPDFHGQSQVMDGASDLFVDLFGDAGLHARLAVGIASLPCNVAVEAAPA